MEGSRKYCKHADSSDIDWADIDQISEDDYSTYLLTIRLEKKQPKTLKKLASRVKYTKGNNILHQFVLDNSNPNDSRGECYINACLMSMLHVPVNRINDEGYTPLHLAVSNRNLVMVKKLLSCFKSIEVNKKCAYSEESMTALHLAAKNGDLPIIQTLLDHEACLDCINSEGKTALNLAEESYKLGFLNSLEASLRDASMYNSPSLYYAVKNGNSTVVTLLMTLGGNINAILHIAAHSGDLSTVKELVVKYGADVNAKNQYGFTVLHRATESGNSTLIKFLLQNGANVPHNASFYNAILNGPEAVAKLLF